MDVTDQRKLEYELDQIRIGERKLFANLPRFQRKEGKHESVKPIQGKQRDRGEPWVYMVVGNERKNMHKHLRRRKGRRVQQWITKNDGKMNEMQEEEWKGIVFNTKETNCEWLQEALVGWVHDPQRILKIQEAMILEGTKFVRVQYMRDNTALFSGEDRVQATKFMEVNKELLSNLFEAFEAWKPNISALETG